MSSDDANRLLQRYGVGMKFYRFTIESDPGEFFTVVGKGMTDEDAFQALVDSGALSRADYDYLKNSEEITEREYEGARPG